MKNVYSGIKLSDAAILDKMIRLKQVFQPSDIVLGFNNINGVAGMRCLIGSTLHGSIRIVNQGTFNPKQFFRIVEHFNVTISILGAHATCELLNHPEIQSANLKSIRIFWCGGTRISYHAIQKMNKYLTSGQFCQSYGLTETHGTVSSNFNHKRNNCVGQLVSGYKAKIVNERGERLGINEIGELCLKSSFSFLGYISVDQYMNNCFDNEGFFMTGDIARFDENNDLFIIDRKKEMFKVFGFVVTPSEIEDFLNQIDGVKQSCIVPVHNVNDEFEKPAALIVKTANSMCSESLIFNSVASKLGMKKMRKINVFF